MSETSGSGLQFDRAEWREAAAGGTCAACHTPIQAVYYQVNDQVLCESCRGAVESTITGGSGIARFAKATALGVVAGAVGAALWYAIRAIPPHLEIGLIAIVVGFLVGGAVRHGAERRGGWPYQLLAMALTYVSIVSTWIPDILEGLRAQNAGESAPGMTLFALVVAFVIALAAPFLMGIQNVIGIIIIGIGLYEAWKMNRKVPMVITGPFHVAPPAPAAAAE
jgi:hypothetical protein